MSSAPRFTSRSLRMLAVLVLAVVILVPSVFGQSPRVTLQPASGRPGMLVSVSGSMFDKTDKSCKITSAPDGLASDTKCMMSNGLAIGTFMVATGANGNYTVQVTGNTGDSASAQFTVTPVTSNPNLPVKTPAPPNQTPYTIYIAAAVAAALIVCITVFVYSKKHKRKTGKKPTA